MYITKDCLVKGSVTWIYWMYPIDRELGFATNFMRCALLIPEQSWMAWFSLMEECQGRLSGLGLWCYFCIWEGRTWSLCMIWRRILRIAESEYTDKAWNTQNLSKVHVKDHSDWDGTDPIILKMQITKDFICTYPYVYIVAFCQAL